MITFLIATLCALAALVVWSMLAPAQATHIALGIERWRSGLVLKAQSIPGFNMPYLEGGSGEVLMLIHGFGGDKDNFTRIAGHLTPHFRVIIPDLPGFGDASRDPAAHYRMADQVARIHAFAQALGIQKMRIGGNSMGGFIATQYAATYPAEVQNIWLLDPAGTQASHDTPMMHHYLATGDMPLLLRKLADVEGLIKATMSKPPYFPACMKKVLGERGVNDYALHSRIFRELAQESPLLETQFTRIETPALIVWGDQDKVLNPKGMQAFEALLPQHRSVLMAGIGHLPMLETPGQTAKDFLHYLGKR